ncbi:MAG TPA: isoprenylcysteine carboxylmethyltransferase family protein [Dehalococcoidia bacterium]|nr:isoprenylcysteine carboxylmethyltransferase family protein [Dehalococcoidia bacterium]
MSLIPAFEIGVWNAWILQVISFLTLSAPNIFMSKEEKERVNRSTESTMLSKLSKTEKWLALSTHVVIMPLAFIYSIFLPLKLGTAWLYVGLPIFTLSLVMSLIATYNFAATPLGEPVTIGIYRISRHPVYLSGFVMYVGIGIACASWVLLLCAVLWIVFWQIAVPAEERFLVEQYGDAYREYIDRTPRWIGIPSRSANQAKALSKTGLP